MTCDIPKSARSAHECAYALPVTLIISITYITLVTLVTLLQEFREWDSYNSRASMPVAFLETESDANKMDCDGHGTHVASTAVGRAVGVAKAARVVGVRVLECDGTGNISNTIAGTYTDFQNSHQNNPCSCTKPCVRGLDSRGMVCACPRVRQNWQHLTRSPVRTLATSFLPAAFQIRQCSRCCLHKRYSRTSKKTTTKQTSVHKKRVQG